MLDKLLDKVKPPHSYKVDEYIILSVVALYLTYVFIYFTATIALTANLASMPHMAASALVIINKLYTFANLGYTISLINVGWCVGLFFYIRRLHKIIDRKDNCKVGFKK